MCGCVDSLVAIDQGKETVSGTKPADSIVEPGGGGMGCCGGVRACGCVLGCCGWVGCVPVFVCLGFVGMYLLPPIAY